MISKRLCTPVGGIFTVSCNPVGTAIPRLPVPSVPAPVVLALPVVPAPPVGIALVDIPPSYAYSPAWPELFGRGSPHSDASGVCMSSGEGWA